MNSVKAYLYLLLCFWLLTSRVSFAQPDSNLIWSDEFDGSGQIDTSKWFQQYILPNGQSWFSGEVQHYTNREQNSFVKDGYLHIVAKKENYASQGVAKEYTSARLNSKFAFKYGRIETRAKMPTGYGLWTAIWTLGQNITENGGYWNKQFGSVQWPACGEMNILEYWGKSPNDILGGVHAPNGWGGGAHQGLAFVNSAETIFHVYETIWNPFEVIFKVDGDEYYRYAPIDKNENNWPLNNKHYLLANIAVRPDIDSTFLQTELLVDYIRVYQTDTLTNVDESNFDNQNFKVYPNPVSNFFTIETSIDLVKSELRIENIAGKEIERIIIQSSIINIDCSNFPPGIYFLSILLDDKIIHQKFIVE